MSIRVFRKAMKTSAFGLAILGSALVLSGCSTFGMGGFSDPTVTGSVGTTGVGNLNQPMPSSLNGATRVAEVPYLPPANVGGGGVGYSSGFTPMGGGQSGAGGVTSQDLPALSSSPVNGNAQAMPASSHSAPLAVAPQTATLANGATGQGGVFMHVIESGESLYTIARRYNVTVQSILSANGLSAPDKIYVGQAVAIPGRPDLVKSAPVTKMASEPHPLASMPSSGAPIVTGRPSSPVNAMVSNMPVDSSKPVERVASLDPTPVEPGPVRPHTAPTAPKLAVAPQRVTQPAPTLSPVAQKPVVQQPTQQVASLPRQGGVPASALQEPAMSGAEKFRWPVSGKVIVDFAASKGTGINIEAPEGAAVRAVENGTVIYVGSGVEGYGNLILIRHANGYVSAYAHLKTMNVAKGNIVNRGDAIGTTGMTGSVNRPQLHFELRKGATPVDPVPLMAG